MYKKAFALFVLMCIFCTFSGVNAYADQNDDTLPSYLKLQSPYVVSEASPKDFFLNLLMEKEICDENNLVPDILTSSRYISTCAIKSGLTEYGTFTDAAYPAELKNYLVNSIGFETSEKIKDADIGDIVFYKNAPGVVVEKDKVLFVDKDYRLFIIRADDMDKVLVIKIQYPYYEQLAMLYMVNELHYTRYKAIGILSNIHFESLCDPAREESSNHMGFGIAQWSKERRLDLEFYSAKNSRNINSIYTQLDFMEYELTNRPDLHDLNYTLNNVTPDEDGAYDAAFIFCETYENPFDATNSAIDRAVAVMDTFYPLYGGLEFPK